MTHDDAHPSHATLQRLIAGWLDEKEAGRANALLAECPDCQRQLDGIMRDRAARRFGTGEPPPPDLPNETVLGGRFRVRRRIAGGAQGAVYEASHADAKGDVRRVAVKVFDLGRWDADARYSRFRTEVLAHANLTHPNVVPIYDFGEHSWTPAGERAPRRLAYYVMELLPDRTLAHMPRPVTPSQAAAIVETLARAMHYVHAKGDGVVHRDLKPSNVLAAADGTWKITDFGLAWFVEGRPDRTQYGPTSGTRDYKAPEQVLGRGEAIGPATDVYGLSAILHDLLTGRPPELATPAWRRFGPRTHVLARICAKGLSATPARRYATAEELANDLRRYRNRDLTVAWPVGRVRRGVVGLWLWTARNRGAFAAILLLALLAVGSAWGAWTYSRQAEENRKLALAADIQRRKAEHLADIARKAFSKSLEGLARKPLPLTAREDRVPSEILREALEFFRTYQDELDRHPARRFESGQTRRWIGDVQQLLGNDGEARQAYLDAETSLAALDSDDPASRPRRREFAQLHNNLGILSMAEGDSEGAEREFQNAVDVLKELAKQSDDPAYRYEEASDLRNLARVLMTRNGRREDAVRALEEAANLLQQLADQESGERKYRWELAAIYAEWANVFGDAKEIEQFTERVTRSISLIDRLAAEDPKDLECRVSQVRLRSGLGANLLNAGRLHDAETHLKDARGMLKRLEPESGVVLDVTAGLREIAVNLQSLASAYADEGDDDVYKSDWPNAETAYKAAISLETELSKEPLAAPGLDEELLSAYLGLGSMFEENNDLVSAKKTLRDAYQCLKGLSPKGDLSRPLMKPLHEAVVALAMNNRSRGDMAFGANRFEDALPLYRESLDILEEAMATVAMADPEIRQEMAQCRQRFAKALIGFADQEEKEGNKPAAQKNRREAAKAYRTAYEDAAKAGEDAAAEEKAQIDADLGEIAGNLALCLQQLGEMQPARKELETALRHFAKAVRGDGSNPHYTEDYLLAVSSLADMLLSQGQHRALAEMMTRCRAELAESPEVDHAAALALVRAVTAAESDALLPDEARKQCAAAYGAQAVGALRDWIRKAYDERHIAFDPTALLPEDKLAPLRSLPDFKGLLAQREERFRMPSHKEP